MATNTRDGLAQADRLFSRMPSGLDLRDEACLETLLAAADALLERSDSIAGLQQLEWLLASDPAAWPLGAQVVVKLARSKALLRLREQRLDLSVVFAVYGEHERMLRPSEHPLGEGFLDRKLRQLDWLVEALPGARTDLWIVDDGCPHGSGELAREILAERHPRASARVLFLADAIEAGHPMARSMTSTDDSRKGGAIQLGLYEATRERRAGQIALFTDADLSTHLGQTGLLVDALDRPGVLLAVGSRRAPTSVVVKSDARSARGRLFIYLWKQLLPEIRYVADTQCGFKAMHGTTAARLLSWAQVRDFAFDLELLVCAEQQRRRSIRSVPIAWIDSEEASTTVALAPYLPMLRSAVALHRRTGSGGERAREFARAIESMSESTWERAVSTLGTRLEACDPSLDVEAAWVAPSELGSLAA